MSIAFGNNKLALDLFHLFIVFLIWNHYRRLVLPFHEKYQTFAPRFWTGTVDLLILTPFVYVFSPENFLKSPLHIFVIMQFIASLLEVLYEILFTGLFGQTIGKMTCKVKIVDAVTENPITWSQAIIRSSPVLLFAVLFLTVKTYKLFNGDLSPENFVSDSEKGLDYVSDIFLGWSLVDIFTTLFNEKRRSIHDYLAGTVVVRTNIKTPPNPAHL